MRCLRERAPIYRAQLAEITGLNKTTVSSLVSELIAQQFVLETGQASEARINGRTGRPAVMLELNPTAGCAIAAEVGVDFLSVAVANFTAHVIWRQTERTRHLQGQQAIIERLLALLRTAIAHGLAATHRVFGIAVGVPALVDARPAPSSLRRTWTGRMCRSAVSSAKRSTSRSFWTTKQISPRWPRRSTARPRATATFCSSAPALAWAAALSAMDRFTAASPVLRASSATCGSRQVRKPARSGGSGCAAAAIRAAGRRTSASAPCLPTSVAGSARASRACWPGRLLSRRPIRAARRSPCR